MEQYAKFIKKIEDTYKGASSKSNEAKESIFKLKEENSVWIKQYNEAMETYSERTSMLSQVKLKELAMSEISMKHKNKMEELETQHEAVQKELISILDHIHQRSVQFCKVWNSGKLGLEQRLKIEHVKRKEENIKKIELLNDHSIRYFIKMLYTLNKEKEDNLKLSNELKEIINSLEEKTSNAKENIQIIDDEINEVISKTENFNNDSNSKVAGIFQSISKKESTIKYLEIRMKQAQRVLEIQNLKKSTSSQRSHQSEYINTHSHSNFSQFNEEKAISNYQFLQTKRAYNDDNAQNETQDYSNIDTNKKQRVLDPKSIYSQVIDEGYNNKKEKNMKKLELVETNSEKYESQFKNEISPAPKMFQFKKRPNVSHVSPMPSSNNSSKMIEDGVSSINYPGFRSSLELMNERNENENIPVIELE